MDNPTIQISEEQEQLKKLDTYRKLIQAILIRYIWFLALVFAICAVILTCLLYKKALGSQTRFEATTRLSFYPRTSTKIKSIDEKRVYQLFARKVMFQKLSEEMSLSPGEQGGIMQNITVDQDKKQTNNYIFTSKANTEDKAIKIVNTFADLCIREYINYRSEDLQNWEDAIVQSRNLVLENIRQTEKEETEMCQDTGFLSPEQELHRLNSMLSTQKLTLADLNVQLANLESLKKKAELPVKNINPAALVHAKKIREYTEDLASIDRGLLKASQEYTDENPKLKVIINQKNELTKEYDSFLQDNGLVGFDMSLLAKLDKYTEELARIVAKIDNVNDSKGAILLEIEENEKKLKNIIEIIPKWTQLKNHRQSLIQSDKSNQEILTEIRYLRSNIPNEMLQMEKATSATGTPALSKKAFIIAVFGAGSLAFLLACAILILEIFFGKVRNAQEMTFYPDLTYLGDIPDTEGEFASKELQKMVLDDIFYNFNVSDTPKKLIFSANLAGVKSTRMLWEEFDWNLAMSGIRKLNINLVNASDFDESVLGKDYVQLGAVCYEGDNGYMPIESHFALSPSEMELLKSDLLELQSNFDFILITRKEPLKRRGPFMMQMLKLCDCALISVAAKRSSRSMLRYIISQQRKSSRCIMTVLTNSISNANLAKGDM